VFSFLLFLDQSTLRVQPFYIRVGFECTYCFFNHVFLFSLSIHLPGWLHDLIHTPYYLLSLSIVVMDTLALLFSSLHEIYFYIKKSTLCLSIFLF
jgi:hypothetical protein